MSLNPKQQKFCEAYSQSLNATKAARTAGYSSRTAKAQGSRLLTNTEIKSEISRLIGKATAKAEISLDWLLAELRLIASADMTTFASWTSRKVTLKSSAELEPGLSAAVECVENRTTREGPQVKLKLVSKLGAINSILRLYEISEIESKMAELEQKLEGKCHCGQG